mgnify:CR=1 FL=1|jgi:hypothetical protein
MLILIKNNGTDKRDNFTKLRIAKCSTISLNLFKFGAVLSGTKYGLRQTRGKFGLGAKMVNFLHTYY